MTALVNMSRNKLLAQTTTVIFLRTSSRKMYCRLRVVRKYQIISVTHGGNRTERITDNCKTIFERKDVDLVL